MQILPTSSSAAGFFGSMSESSDGGNFLNAMQDALSAVNDGDYISADQALGQDAPAVESPYSTHTTDGVTYTMGEVLFTKQELAELRLQLLKEGAPVESLEQFDILADQPNGATLAQVMASLMAKPNAGKFNADDEQAIASFLGQIDPTGDLAKNVLDQMRSGNGMGALDLIQNALGNLGLDETIDIDLETALALGRGLGLNNDSLRQMGEKFGGYNSLRLNAGQFDTLMTPAKNQFMAEAANAEKLDAALEKTLKPIISKARDRMQKEKEAAERESRRVQQSKILIDKTVQSNSREMMDETLAGAKTDLAGQESELVGHAGDKANLKQAMQANANNAQSAVNAPAAQVDQTAAKFTGEDQSKEKGKQDGWSDLFAKTEIRPAAATPAPTANSMVYSMVQAAVDEAPVFGQNIQPSFQEPLLGRQVAGQVEQGLLTAMRDGATRMDLQLHPAELGNVAITLIARNGEVTALIRSEKTETAELMQRQAESIRINLENQGVRVDKIEVQLENKPDNGQNAMQDLGQHNARQEEDARRQELNRLRNLANIRNSVGSQENSPLAQSVHNTGQTARYAGQALHVVA